MHLYNYDVMGVGIGPFNLGLAALLSSHTALTCRFVDKKKAFNWHPGVMLPGTTLQVPFLADLVSMADPTHPLSFLNYLNVRQRLYQFYYKEDFHLYREEYNDYCRWAAEQLSHCHFGEEAQHLEVDRERDGYVVTTRDGNAKQHHYFARHLAVGIGTIPWRPQWASSSEALILHSSEFAHHQRQLNQCRKVAVVGSGQSAAECVLALAEAMTPERIAEGAEVYWITRSPGFHPMEYSKLGQACFTPDYMNYFHSLERRERKRLIKTQDLLYKGISMETIAHIYDLMYERTIGGKSSGITLVADCNVSDAQANAERMISLSLHHQRLMQQDRITVDAVVTATGYKHAWPEWLVGMLGDELVPDSDGELMVDANFVACSAHDGTRRIFIQNAELSQHGVGSPDLGMGAYRNACIINQLLGQRYYTPPDVSSFQHYGPLSQ